MPILHAILRGAHDNTCGTMIPIEAGSELGVGRDSSNDIVISTSFISNFHCKFTSKVDHASHLSFVYLTDLSDNGTYLDGTLIGRNKTVILLPNAIVSFVSSHLSMNFIQIKLYENDRYSDEIFTMDFHPGLLFNPERKKDKVLTVKTTRRKIGHGNQADVLLAYECSKPSHQLVVRRIDVKPSKKEEIESQILKKNRHVNVLAMIAQFKRDQTVRSFFPLYIGGTLRQRVKQKSCLTEENASFLFKQVLSGLQYIHQNGIIHCDLKPENLLLSGLEDRTRIVIADFGLSVYKANASKLWPSDYGTAANHPPEVLKHEEYSEKVDCWCAGLVLYYMISGEHPFIDYVDYYLDLNILYKKILNESPRFDTSAFENTSTMTKSLISALLDKDQHARYNCDDCFETQWMVNLWSRDKAFVEDYRVAVVQDFQLERERWFDDEDFKVNEFPVAPTTHHPDDNEDDIAIIKKLRSADHRHSICTFKKILSYEVEDEGPILDVINAQRLPKLLLGKRKDRENDVDELEQSFSFAVNVSNSFGKDSTSVPALNAGQDDFSVQSGNVSRTEAVVTATTVSMTTTVTTITTLEHAGPTTSKSPKPTTP